MIVGVGMAYFEMFQLTFCRHSASHASVVSSIGSSIAAANDLSIIMMMTCQYVIEAIANVLRLDQVKVAAKL
jgi:hypothetical protein